MTYTASIPRPPITQLRPLHSHQQTTDSQLNESLSRVQDNQKDCSPLLQWRSSLEPIPDRDISIKAFVKLVSLIVVLDQGELYCIQDVARGGFILARSSGPDDECESENFSFIDYADSDGIVTDFSIGKGKALQLHFDTTTTQVQLIADTTVIPSVALQSLGRMLDDIIIRERHVKSSSCCWTQPSVLNFPPRSRPIPLFPQSLTHPNKWQDEENDNEGNEPALLHRSFEKRVVENPDRTALDFLMCIESGKRIQYSYQQVENASNALAAELVSIYAHSHSSVKTVAVLMGPCPELYISYLAALKAGVAFYPIPIDAPEERKGALIADLTPSALLVSTSTRPGSSSSSWSSAVTMIDVTPFLTACDVKPDTSAISSLPTKETDVAYVLHTSGTTGMPKGVAISHISAACTISAVSSHYGLVSPQSSAVSEPIRWFQGAAPTFDISLFEIFWTLSTGSTLCCAPREFTLQNIDKVVTVFKADITNITPSFANLLDPSSIRGLMVGGETLNARLLRDFAQYNPTEDSGNSMDRPSGIYNGYGPTETAIYCIAQAHILAEQRGSVLGTPLATCGILIVDERMQAQTQAKSLEPVPMGAIGELVITGPQVSTEGYLNRPDETAHAFINDAQWGRAYKTGDRARIVWDPQGKPVVEFLGRLSDDQVKLSGRRVELGEIDSLLTNRVEGIREMLSCTWKQKISETGSEKVVSLVVLDPRAELDFEVVKHTCMAIAKQHLPDYMRPFNILQVEALPKSASGKVNRKAASAYVWDTLQEDDGHLQLAPSHEINAEHVEPLSDPEYVTLEAKLVSIVSSILNGNSPTTKNVFTATTSLSNAGMDSLCAMKVLRDIRKQWPISGSIAQQYEYACLQPSLAQLLDSGASVRSVFFPSMSDSESSNKLAAKETLVRDQLAEFSDKYVSEALDKLHLSSKEDIEMILPATCTQSQLAISFAMDRRKYISHSVLRLKPGVSAESLQRAVEAVVSEQPIYRCAMIPCDDPLSPFAQVILKPEAWHRLNQNESRFVHMRVGADRVVGDTKPWLDLAEGKMSLESQVLYHVQVIEPDLNQDSDSIITGLLVISVAHCICDGASLEVLIGDIARCYAGLESQPRQGIYETVLEWHLNLDSETDNLWLKSMEGWETENFGVLSGSNMKMKPSGVSGGRDCEHGVVQYASDLSWQSLEDKSRTLSASPLSILQASWSMLLQLFSEADTGDITFGSVISGHHVSTHAPTFSVVPCRVALPEIQTIGQLLNNLTEQSKFAQSHRHMSFGIFKALPYNTALALQAYSPPNPESEHGSEEAPAFWDNIQNPAIRYDFAIFAEVFPTDPHSPAQDGQLTFKLTYRGDALSELSASCIVKQFGALVETILGSIPEDLVQTLPARLPRSLLSAEGTIPILAEGTKEHDQHSLHRDELLHSQFESQAASTPDLLALSFYASLDSPPVELSYAELDARANGLANILREEDVEIIPICLQRSIELYVAVLAILKAGSAWCPIDETSPVQRRTSLIARTQSKVLLTTTESLFLVEPCLAHESLEGVRVILIDQYANQKSSERAEPRLGVSSSHSLCGQDLAYLLWTSGTTGEPKGVMIQHTAAAQAMRDLQIQVEHDETAEQVRTLQLSAYSFDVFVQDLFYTWGLAGSVISGTRELVLGTFVEFIWKSQPTHAHLTPSFGASIAVDEIRGSTLQYVTFIGEKLTEDVAEAWAAPGITTRAYNTYGPAENAVVSTLRQFYGKSRDQANAANVGFPLKHCTSYVVREVEIPQQTQKRWELVPRYGVGELALGGAQVGKGYLGNETKTAKAFIQGGPGIDERIYLTGDIVRLNDHGFEFLGRNDDLVKITGIRIELSEISAACASVKDEEAAVEHVETLYLLRPGASTDSNNKVVVTFVSVKKSNVDTSKIRAQVFRRARDMLPVYMVPGHVVVLETTMPRTASNKVDRKALQEIYKGSDLTVLAGRDSLEQSVGNDQHTKPHWTEEQLSVLQTIADNFHVAVEPLAPEDSLAGLGFSSLQVTKLAWTLRRQLNCAVGVLDLMKCQFLGELVDAVLSKLPDSKSADPQTNGLATQENSTETSWIASAKAMLTDSLRGDLRPQDTLYILPSTPMQESLIVETMLEPRAYWAHRIFDLSHLGDIDVCRLQDAWTAAARKFDILRTIFVPLTQLDIEQTSEHDNIVTWARQHCIQSTILQLVRGTPEVRWTLLSSDKGENLATTAEKLQIELAPTRTTQPPWSVTFSKTDGKLMLSMHHALYDSVSSEILLDTVASLYQKKNEDCCGDVLQFEKGMGLGLLPTGSQRNEAASLWNSRLDELRKTSGALNANFPDLTQSRQKQPQRILLAKKAVPSSLLTSASGSPALPLLFQSAFGCILASYLELKAVVFGQTVSQRILHPDLANVMGPAMATLPVIVRADSPSAEKLWSDMAVDSSSLFRITHSLHPVDIKRMLNQGTGSSQAPFPGLFVYHPAPDAGTGPVSQFFQEIGQALSLNVEHPLALNFFEADGTMELTGDGRRISQGQLDLMLNQIIDQAQAMVEFPRSPLDRLQNTMNRSLISISGVATVEEVCAVDPTEKVSMYASEHPEWIAAEELFLQESDEGEDIIVTKTITYSQLNTLANAIMSKLESQVPRLQPEDVVAMYLGRDIKSLAATLAIFRAGFVYLPIDQDLPVARKQLLVRDAKAKLLVTTEDLSRDLDLNLDNDPPALLVPDGDDDVKTLLSWPVAQRQAKNGHGGYLLYTSGSTGRPKGVRVSNNNLGHFIASFSTRLIEFSPATANLGGAGKYLNLTSRAFDPHLTQLFVPWHLGHRVVIGKDRTAILGSLQQVINDVGITHFGSVPSVLTQLRLRPKDVPSVRVVTTGGEKASSELLDAWARDCDSADGEGAQQDVVLFNFYGPTEVTIGCLGHAVNRDSNARNLGLPLQGLEALLLCPGTGDEQVIARRGQPGELCIAGPQVAMGYLERPIENAKSFQTTSLLGDGPKRIYKTGDIMRMMHDGTLEFLGRADEQTKIRGQRLELSEVVSFLKEASADEGELDFAATVAASGNDGSNQQQQLLAFVARKAKSLLKGEASAEVELLPNQGQALTSILERIGQKCETGLPAFMVPTMLWVSRIPYLAASGKVDTKLLAKLAKDFFESQQSQQGIEDASTTVSKSQSAALDTMESVVVTAIEEAVGSKTNATSTSSIHRLGIDSLSAVHMVSLLRRRGFSKLNMTDVLSASCTVGHIVRLADQGLNGGTTIDSITISTPTKLSSTDIIAQVKALNKGDLGPIADSLSDSKIEAILPCLPLQASLIARSLVWLSANSDIKDVDATTDVPYVAQFHYHLSSGTNIARWKKAAELVLASEAMLRTCFVQREADGQIFQLVLRLPPCPPFDGAGDPAEMVAQMNIRPPIRLQVRETDQSGKTVVSLKIHHALFDGVAIDVLRKRLAQCYDQEVLPALSSKSMHLLNDISTHCHLSDSRLQSTKLAWQSRLRGVRPCRVESNSYNNTHNNMARSTMCFTLTASELKAKLRDDSQQSGQSISLSSAFQLATALCLAKLAKQTSIVYGFVMSLRPLLSHISESVDNFVGPCLNTLVETISLPRGQETLPEVAQRVHNAHLGACQDAMPLVGVENVQRWAGSEDKLFDSLLSINIVPENAATDSETQPGRMIALRTHSKSDMALAIDVDLHTDGKIVLTFSSAGALDESQLNEIGQLFEKVVCSSADENATVEQFVTLSYDVGEVAANSHQLSKNFEPEQNDVNESYQQALACVQNAICRLLRLDLSEVSAKAKTTSLYQMGLDSITVLPFAKFINKSEKIKLTPDAVLKARTIQGAAKLVQAAKAKAGTIASNDIRRDGLEIAHQKADENTNSADTYDNTLARLARELFFVATPLQEGMLSASLAIAGKAYTYAHTIQLSENAVQADGPNFANFWAAIRDTVQACEILRTRFIFTQDDEAPWVGMVSPTEQSDLVNWEEVKSESLVRFQLRIHHALYDAASIQDMWRILNDNYCKRLQGHAQNTEETATYLFRPFARAVSMAQKDSVNFWANFVAGYDYTPLNLSSDSLQASSSFQFSLGEEDMLFLQTRCRELGVTTKAALQLAWAKVLCESVYSQADVVYGEVVSTGGGFESDSDTVMVGPTINTVPMRFKLSDGGIAISVAESLTRVQRLSDDARGTNSMASLRKVQTLWRESSQDQELIPANLFQSLFVFDGVVEYADTDSTTSEKPLFKSVQNQDHIENVQGQASKAPAYDDYPLIVSFHIKNNVLHGKLRAKLNTEEVGSLGSRLEEAVKCIVANELQKPTIDISHMKIKETQISPTKRGEANGTVTELDMNGLTPTADAVLNVVKTVLGTRCQGKKIGYNTRLVNAGLDSILAIRLSKALKKQMGISASVFDIIKGACVHDIVQKTTSTKTAIVQQTKVQTSTEEGEVKVLVAEKLGLPTELIQSVLPVLAGQRVHLEQWLHNGKRFFEAPWVYRVLDDSLDAKKVASCWAELCRIHEVLRTTFVWTDKAIGLAQVTLADKWIGEEERLVVVQDLSRNTVDLIDEHVNEENSKPSDLRKPPARLSFLEASNGKAVVLRLHHALYDAWSIKMIEKDFNQLLALDKLPQTRASLSQVVSQIRDVRHLDAEKSYWKKHLSQAQDTVLQSASESDASLQSAQISPLGPHFKIRYSAIVSQHAIDLLAQNKSNSGTSAAIILAYARTLGHFTKRSQPTFGLHHASRSLSSADGAQTLDLTAASIPTLTVTPFSMDLDSKSMESSADEHLLDFVQDHLAQLTKFAQADDVEKFCCPRFNSYINILFPGDSTIGVQQDDPSHTTENVLSRHRLAEPLASEYFTATESSASTVSTIEGLKTSHLCPHRFFMNVIIREGQDISVAASGDGMLFDGDLSMVTNFVSCFGVELARVIEGAHINNV